MHLCLFSPLLPLEPRSFEISANPPVLVAMSSGELKEQRRP
jgi:hypothetical protein